MKRGISVVLLGGVVVAWAALPHAQAQVQPQTPAQVVAPAAEPSLRTVPAQLSDAEFWTMRDAMSEPPGEFRSENLVSNETMFQWPIPELVKTVSPGAVYMGVAPDQNFTYLAALKPTMAFIVDIRRGNVLQHLLYKALFELSADRAEFAARLFSMPKPAGITATSNARELFDAIYIQKADPTLFEANKRAVLDLLVTKHGFSLSAADQEQLNWIYSCFYNFGPDLTYQTCVPPPGIGGFGGGGGFGGRGGGRFGGGFGGGFGGAFRSFADMQVQTDAAGAQHAYLATEANYQWMKDFEAKNLLVPVTGDFMGPKAIRAVGAWVREHGAIVGTFYTSNVEQYLFQSATWGNFYGNVATLPLDNGSVFIRSVPSNNVMPAQPGARAASMLCSIQDLVKAFAAGEIRGYSDVIRLSRQESLFFRVEPEHRERAGEGQREQAVRPPV